jgi:Raf kinase inhibitor-like YbhB/YbcL family protein
VDHTGAVIRRTLLLLAALTLLGAGCSDDGRTLAPIGPGQTTTTTSVPPSIGAGEPDVFSLRSGAFDDGAVIPERFTCTGEDISPSIGWTATPPDAVELAIVVRDRQADGFVHWIVTGIDPTVTGFGDSGVPEGAVEQVNSTGAIGWLGPCPPEGSGTHLYDFTLHALARPVDIDPALPAVDAAAQIESFSTAEATLAGSVTPGGQPAAGSR